MKWFLNSVRAAAWMAVAALLMNASAVQAQEQGALKVCATVPDLGSLAKEVGGDGISVTVFGKGPEDPHFIEAKPSFIKATSEADVYLQLGLELEVGYSPVLLNNSRNARVLPNGRGFVDCSRVIEPLERAAGPVDRSQGDVHAGGNPHYMLDPLNGLKVAALLRDKFTELRPEKKEYFAGRYNDFRERMAKAMVGEALAKQYEFEKLALLAEHGKLGDFLKSQGQEKLLGGWLGAMLPYYGTKYADEHALWVYFAQRFGLVGIGHMEPVPGITPTTKQLGVLIEKMRAEKVGLILHVPYYDARHARFAAEKTGAKAVTLANQCGAVPGTEDYLAMIDVNVKTVVAALGGAR
jgi:ABC-type Zn uptake system ZnuABC Zn-binding protein ZnuA